MSNGEKLCADGGQLAVHGLCTTSAHDRVAKSTGYPHETRLLNLCTDTHCYHWESIENTSAEQQYPMLLKGVVLTESAWDKTAYLTSNRLVWSGWNSVGRNSFQESLNYFHPDIYFGRPCSSRIYDRMSVDIFDKRGVKQHNAQPMSTRARSSAG